MAYQVLTADNKTLIVDTESGIQVKVKEKAELKVIGETAYCIATLYRIRGGFIPEKIFAFEATKHTELETMRKIVDFFFTTILGTDLFVKEVPPDSALFAQEAERLFGKKEEIKDGTVSVICNSGTE